MKNQDISIEKQHTTENIKAALKRIEQKKAKIEELKKQLGLDKYLKWRLTEKWELINESIATMLEYRAVLKSL